MPILTIYKNKSKYDNNKTYYFCNFYNVKINKDMWLTEDDINSLNSSIPNMNIKYKDGSMLQTSDNLLDDLMSQYTNFKDCNT